MTVRKTDDTIRLEGRCGVEDAETLLAALQDAPEAVVDITAVHKLHMAVAQVLLALRPVIRGVPESAFLARNIFEPMISDSDRATKTP
ncbi:hypothetical protein QUC32_28155 (plasmid) [Novosphingobium resinovorum]|uniref:STAS domain-containing protein n=1 Tax=Novosphingobium resinovorum TaxID=158500 RepID=A0A1D8AF37_9SPHN|nr:MULTISPECIES: hypothetical protein [Novosphingobium]AOR80717.1 hypothetical protein BES08_28305 [Novosphingobium resinovorum]MBF7015561.1 hypothetical protein [Novosphingobium sp. HR1a]WJM30237.1 hypothetical protein QUC32_28155 [Novosphingobium resinovorum]